MKIPVVLVASDYPLHSDGFRSYLKGFYHVEWVKGLAMLELALRQTEVVAVIVDDTFWPDALLLAQEIKKHHPVCGLIYVDAKPNLFRVLHYLDAGFAAYLYPGDSLAESLRLIVDMARRRERFLSPTILHLYEQYMAYRGLFMHLPDALSSIFKLMGEGLSVEQIMRRTGLSREVIYRRQYRLRQHFGAETNAEMIGVLTASRETMNANAPFTGV